MSPAGLWCSAFTLWQVWHSDTNLAIYRFMMFQQNSSLRSIVTSQDVRLEIERRQKCALHSCIENLGNFRAFK
jgi:hypothetical protein